MPKTQEPGNTSGPSGPEIADWILKRIRSRRFVPGQRLVEFDITRMTGGSRYKVREALQRLAAEGLVEIEEHRGASVRNASMDEVRQLYMARGALEGICAADFTRRATAEQRAQLQAIGDEMERVVELGTPEIFGGLNAQWHGLIMEGSGNPVIRSLVQRLNTPIHHLLFGTFYSADRLRSAATDHRVILECILKNDPDGAQAAMRRHIEAGYLFLSTLDSALHFDERAF
jgi:DNA-binding GntR family transcriptional regulator